MALAVMSSTTTITSSPSKSIKLLPNPDSNPEPPGVSSVKKEVSPVYHDDEDIFSGIYEFQRYDDHLEEYLDSLGLIGRDLGRIVRQTRVKIDLRKPIKHDEKWTLTTSEYSKLKV